MLLANGEFKKILLDNNLIESEDQVDEFMKNAKAEGVSLYSYLVTNKLVDRKQMGEYVAFVYKVPKEVAEKNVENIRKKIKFWEESKRDNHPRRTISFAALANEALKKGLISTGRYAEYLGITRREAMRQVEQEALEDAEVEVAHP